MFPPEITAPIFLWRDATPGATWSIDIAFAGGSASLHFTSRGEPAQAEKIDRRAIASTNQLPQPPAAHTWTPDAASWEKIKLHSVNAPAAITITNSAAQAARVTLHTSRDPVGAPIFYRDVPLMPSEVEKGVIKPLATAGIPLIGWRLRDLSKPDSRLVLEGLHTCTNCHSFSRDGKTLGMDVDGPENDKGTYAIAGIAPRMSIGTDSVITWNSFPGKPAGQRTIGFLSQISPDGQYAVTTVNEELYVANFKDYRFLQVFYPTRGILAWYNRSTREMRALPGADDPRYVQTDGVWSPDGQYLVFARAEARDAYPPGRKPAEFANDPNELPMQYSLYRVPFHNGKGGVAEPIAGASHDGMSNSFPKVSPDGRWIVFVKSRNGQLMRPDSELYIVPAGGGEARRMRCNTSLMNSWHSFSPNGRWLVFSSKSRSPYTQMFLTHLDEQGNDSPPILVENATAANRAVNLPEFLNVAQDGLLRIEMPAAEFYRLFDSALDLEAQGRHSDAIAEWRKALAIDSENAKAHTNLGIALSRNGDSVGAMAEFRRAVELNPNFTEAHNNLGVALVQAERFEEAIPHFRLVLGARPDSAEVHQNLAVALLQSRRPGEAIPHFEKVLEGNPEDAAIHFSLGNALYLQGRIAEAVEHWRHGLRSQPANLPVLNQTAWVLATCRDAAVRNGADALLLARQALQLTGGKEPAVLDTLGAAYAELGRFDEAIESVRRALSLSQDAQRTQELKTRLALYQQRRPFR